MKTIQLLRRAAVLGGFGLATLSAWAQQGSIELRVTDQRTGFAVPAARIEVLPPAGRAEQAAAARTGRWTLSRALGTYRFRVSAPGYAPLETQFVAGQVPQLTAEVQLDPLPAAQAQLQTAARPALTARQTLLEGYVSNRATGEPLAGVQVQAGAASATTDAQGFYRLVVTSPGQPSPEGVKQVVDLTFTKAGFTGHQLQRFRLIGADYTVKMSLAPDEAGSAAAGRAAPETEVLQHGFFDKKAAPAGEPVPLPAEAQGAAGAAAVTVPASIRLGLNCSCNTCSSVSVMSLESYVEAGLDDEWIASWGAASLQAGSVAYRTYGAYFVARPLNANYDISSTPCKQNWVAGVNAACRSAAQATSGQVLQKNGVIAFAEYAAETNNFGCGDGYGGEPGVYPCFSDAVCAGKAAYGHGRGMCQWGSQRWSQQGKTYRWILDHYYTPGGIGLDAGPDTQAPTTSITGPASASTAFTVSFADADNVGVTERFYQPLEWRSTEWRANRGNGFFNDNFVGSTINTEWTIRTGQWIMTLDGRLKQANTTLTNTNISTALSQTSGNTYLYNFAAKLNSTAGNRRFGLHLMASDVAAQERGNSYLVWFSADDQKVRIIETVNNVLNERASVSLSIPAAAWADYKASYNTSTGTLNVYVNNALRLSWTDTTPLTSGAGITLRTNQAEVEFDDLKVYKSRGASASISVGTANSNDVRTAGMPGAKVKSLVKDAAHNWSTVGNLDVNISLPAAAVASATSFSLTPNPIGPEAPTVRYTLPEAATVTLDVYDSRGTRLFTLQQAAEAGAHLVQVPASVLARRGMYVVRLSAGKQQQTLNWLKE